MAVSLIDRVVLRRLVLPLAKPYKLAITVVKAFDTIVAEVHDKDGRVGYGEATVLTGYTDETIAESWNLVRALGARLPGLTTEAGKALIAGKVETAPFAATSLASALEMIERHPLLSVSAHTSVPLLAIVNEMDEAKIAAEIEQRLAEGYGTLKVKVGFDVEPDVKRVAFIQRLVGRRARIRIDGNQGYDRDAALRFVHQLAPDGIELFEQPCAADDWDSAVAVAKEASVPMMLDESIYGIEEIERAAKLRAARFIKLKLMKAGSVQALADGLKRIRDLGMVPVLGNGVAADIGCWMEAAIARGLIDNAGEMNGFLKPTARQLVRPIAVEKGAMVLEPGTLPAVDGAALAAQAAETAVFPE